MFLRKVVLISFILIITTVNVNASDSSGSKTKYFQTEFTPLIPLPAYSDPVEAKSCTGGVMLQEIILFTDSSMPGGGNGGGMTPPGGGNGGMPPPANPSRPAVYTMGFIVKTSLAYNDPTGVNNALCRRIPLFANLAFVSAAFTEDGVLTEYTANKDPSYAKAASSVSSVIINDFGGYHVNVTGASKIVCLKTSHLTNAAGVVILKDRELCDELF